MVYLLLLTASVLSFLLTLVYAPVYDYADWTLPKKIFITEALNNGILPLWNPYQSMGFPEHIDVNLFYLPTWILALFGRYIPVMWGIEEVLYAFIAAIGFFKLSKHFGTSSKAAFIMSVAYINSGVFIGNTQHFAWIIGMVWMPFVLLYFIRLLEQPDMKNAICLAVFGSLLLSGAYQGFVFVLLWLFVIMLVSYVLSNGRLKEKGYIRKLIIYLAVCGLVCLVLSLPYIISILSSTDFIIRGKPVAYEKTTAVPFTLKGLLSLFFPYVACTEGGFTGTDISMGSVFIGVMNLFFCGLGLRNIKSNVLKVIVIWGLFCGIVSLGNVTPIHKLAFNIFPLFNYIRVVALFRIWFMLSLLILAVIGWNKYLQDREERYKRPFIYFLCGVALMYMAVLIFCSVKSPDAFHNLYSLNIKGLLHNGIEGKFIFTAVFEIIVTVASFIILILGNKRFKYGLLIMVICIEMILTSWLCLRYTGLNIEHTNKESAKQIATIPSGYPVPQATKSITDIAQQHNINCLWQNIGMVCKEIEYGSYNPLYLVKHEAMLKPYDKREIPLLLPVAFFPNIIIRSDTAIIFNRDTAYSSDANQTKQYSGQSQIRISVFEPNNILMQCKTDTERVLVISQNCYPGWKATINGIESPINTINTSLMSVKVPKGESEIWFHYSRPDVIICLIVASTGWIVVLAYLFIIPLFRKRR
jgi:hypothetical protein